MADTNKKYLDLTGVDTLWKAVKAEDAALASSISTSKASAIRFNESSKEVELLDKENGTVLSSFDASDFLIDGMINDVAVVEASETKPINGATSGTYLKFTWNDGNNDGEADKVTYIEASKIGKIYAGSDSIAIDATTNAISVKEVDANITKTTREMVVSSAIGDYAANAVIPEGTDIMAILANIFEKTLGIKTTQPSASLSLVSGGNNAGTYEYGSPISATWNASLNGGKYEGNGWTTTQSTGVTAKKYTWSNASVDGDTDSSGVVDIDTLTATTTVKVVISYDQGNMPVDNKGNELSGNRISAGTKEATKTYTPAKYWFIGYSNDVYSTGYWDSDKVRALDLAKDWTSTKSKTVVFPKGAKQQVIAVPSGTTISTIVDGAGSDIKGTYNGDVTMFTVSVLCGGTTDVVYDVYVAPANAGLAADSKAVFTIA